MNPNPISVISGQPVQAPQTPLVPRHGPPSPSSIEAVDQGQPDAMDVDQDTDDAGGDDYEYYEEEGDHEWEEEEAYYIFDFGKNLTLPELRAAGNQCKILGLDTDNPFVQIGPAVFRGSSMESLGQDIIFAKHPSLHALDEESASKFDDNHPGRYPHLQMLHIMDRRVKMTPVRLRQKESGSKDPVDQKPQQPRQPQQPAPEQLADVGSSSAVGE